MSPLVRRIVSGLGANVFGQGITILIQLLSVPIFLHYWDAATYGKWLMLSAVPAYFAMADMGLVAVAANKMTMCYARDEVEKANQIFQSALAMTLGVAVVFFALAAVVVMSLPEIMNAHQWRIALLALILLALLNIGGGLFEAVFRAMGAYAKGVYALNFARLIESCTGLLALFLGCGFQGVAVGFLLGRLFIFSLIAIYVVRKYSSFIWSTKGADKNEIREMLKPALAFMAFPIGNAVSIQGMSLLVGSLLGPSFLAVFNTYRTLSRVLVQFITTVSRSVWPEISRLYGLGDYAKIVRLYRMGSLVFGLVSVILALLIFASADWILQFWTHGKIELNRGLFALFLLSTVVTAFWQMAMVVMMASNTHGHISVAYLLASVLVVALAYFLGAYWGGYAFAGALVLFEVIMFYMCHRSAKKVLVGVLV